jgi:hypothetical protein
MNDINVNDTAGAVETSPQNETERLRELAESARDYQLAREWSEARLCREIGHLGRPKLFARVLESEDSLEDLDVSGLLRNYQAAAQMIAARRARERPPEPEYDDFANVIAVKQAIASALQEESIKRFVCIEGQSGTGKDAAIHALQRTWPNIIAVVEAHELWRESNALPMADILTALSSKRRSEGVDPLPCPLFPSQRMLVIRAELTRRPIVLLINEAHHCGPRGLNFVKWIINNTQTVVGFFCAPILLQRLLKSGFEEGHPTLWQSALPPCQT